MPRVGSAVPRKHPSSSKRRCASGRRPSASPPPHSATSEGSAGRPGPQSEASHAALVRAFTPDWRDTQPRPRVALRRKVVDFFVANPDRRFLVIVGPWRVSAAPRESFRLVVACRSDQRAEVSILAFDASEDLQQFFAAHPDEAAARALWQLKMWRCPTDFFEIVDACADGEIEVVRGR